MSRPLDLVHPDLLNSLIDAMGRVDHGSDWDGPSHFPDGKPYVWTGKPVPIEGEHNPALCDCPFCALVGLTAVDEEKIDR